MARLDLIYLNLSAFPANRPCKIGGLAPGATAYFYAALMIDA
jgi:hypothetical protein